MLPISLAVRPIVDVQSTPLQSGNTITSCNLIDIRNGYIQKQLGCTQLTASTFAGTASRLFPWSDLAGNDYLALGTTAGRIAVLSGITLNDVTPVSVGGDGHWFFDNFGQDLIACTHGSTIFAWVPPPAGGNIAVAIAGAPSVVSGLFVAAPQQQIIAFGIHSSTLGTLDPMLVGWCDVANFNDWTATATNQAGTFRLSTGSKIIGGTWFGLAGLLWTDVDLWTMTYAGFPLVYSFNRIAQHCGLIGHYAWATLGSTVAWMSLNDFFVYRGGQVEPIPCTVRDFVFNNIDRNYDAEIHADANTYTGSICWRFPTIGSAGVCTSYVKWTPNENNAWDFGQGQPQLSAWTDQSVLGPPIGADYNGLLQQFQTSNDFNGAVLNSNFTTGWFTLAEGQEFIFIERILPDFILNTGGQVQMTIVVADEIPALDTDYPVRTYGPYTVTQSTPFIIVRARGRVAKLTVECIAANTFWRYGKPLAVVSVDGRRG